MRVKVRQGRGLVYLVNVCYTLAEVKVDILAVPEAVDLQQGCVAGLYVLAPVCDKRGHDSSSSSLLGREEAITKVSTAAVEQ